jgi:uncharacterized phage protein gp47/JayE
MIPVPNLDDRTWKDLVDEAIRLIPKYCPEWTNHNPSDPGITLIELFAWLMEMSIYRLNKVTDKNFLAFLDLMGIDPQPPQPAKALLTFRLVQAARNFQVVPAGTGVATERKGDEEPLKFETIKDLIVLPIELKKCYTQFHDVFDDCMDRITTDRSEELKPGRSFEVFMGCKRIERLIYLSDPNFETISGDAMVIVGVTTPESPDTNFPILCDWEFWNGHRWRELNRASAELPHGYIAFEGSDEFEECEINGVTGFWIRGRLVEVPKQKEATIVDKVFARVEIVGEGVQPSAIGTLMDDDLFVNIDTSKNFYPFQKIPKTDFILYLTQPELFGHPGARVIIDCKLAEATIADAPKPSADLQLSWEYHDGKRWQKIAVVTPKRVEESLSGADFEDTTRAFTESGVIAFNIPPNMNKALSFQGVEAPWVRARIISGHYGKQGSYELEGDRWVWMEEQPLRPPVLRDITLRYAEPDRTPAHVLTYNDFRMKDITDDVNSDLSHVQVFEPIPDESPSVYLGFNAPFPNEPIQVFFHVVEKTSLELVREHEEKLKEYYIKMEEMYYGDKSIVWEYWDGAKWTDLGVTDRTRGFTESNFIEFLGPKDLAPTRKFGELLFWIRCRLEMGGYEQLPRIDSIMLNTVEAEHRTSLKFEVLGSGQGTPNEKFRFMNTPVLSEEEIWVREKEMPGDDELADVRAAFGPERSKYMRDDASGEKVIRWRGVESFYASGPRSRHYRIDRITGEVFFGDGRRGMVVPKGDQNVRTQLYRIGGGSRGNVGPRKIVQMQQSIAYIDGVINYYAAQGGSDMESVDELKLRGPHLIKSRDRAVTKDDFEWLALQSSASISRTHCLPSMEREGEVTVVIVPKFNEDNPDYSEKLIPSTELLRRVKAFLDERRLVTVKVNVEKPQYREISVSLDVVRSPQGSGERLRRDIEQALRKFLHPIHGGRTEEGWEFGRSILKVDLYHVAEEVEGVDFVDRIQIFDEDKKVFVEQVKVSVKELPFLVNVEVTEKARERIL